MKIAIKENVSCYASKMQQEVLDSLCGIKDISENFFLTGGTALSIFYLHHRTSEDLDLFTTKSQDLAQIDFDLKRLFTKDLTIIRSSQDFYSYVIKGVKVDIVYDPLSTTEGRSHVILKRGQKLFIDTLDNIASNKLAAISSRSEPKDIVDFYFINRTVWKEPDTKLFLDCYEMARKKEALLDDPAMTAYQIEELFHRVLTEKEQILPPMLMKMDWDLFEKDLSFYIEIIYKMHKW